MASGDIHVNVLEKDFLFKEINNLAFSDIDRKTALNDRGFGTADLNSLPSILIRYLPSGNEFR